MGGLETGLQMETLGANPDARHLGHLQLTSKTYAQVATGKILWFWFTDRAGQNKSPWLVQTVSDHTGRAQLSPRDPEGDAIADRSRNERN